MYYEHTLSATHAKFQLLNIYYKLWMCSKIKICFCCCWCHICVLKIYNPRRNYSCQQKKKKQSKKSSKSHSYQKHVLSSF